MAGGFRLPPEEDGNRQKQFPPAFLVTSLKRCKLGDLSGSTSFRPESLLCEANNKIDASQRRMNDRHDSYRYHQIYRPMFEYDGLRTRRELHFSFFVRHWS
jgi:hypothetical protein